MRIRVVSIEVKCDFCGKTLVPASAVEYKIHVPTGIFFTGELDLYFTFCYNGTCSNNWYTQHGVEGFPLQ